MKIPALALSSALLALLSACGGGGGGGSTSPGPTPEVWRQAGIAVGNDAGNLLPGLAGVIMAEVVRCPGGYRMYVGAHNLSDGSMDIDYAESADGDTWTMKGVALASQGGPSGPEFQICGASILTLPGGRIRMYYQGTPNQGVTPRPYQLFSAISTDGVHFTREGIRLSSSLVDPTSPLVAAGRGRVIQLSSGGYELIFNGATSFAGGGWISVASSSDGLAFSQFQEAFLGHDPLVIWATDHFCLYYDSSVPGGGSVASAPLFTSTDGLTWNGSGQTAIFQNASGTPLVFSSDAVANSIGDIGGVVMADGHLRLFSNMIGMGSEIAYYERVNP